MSAVDVLADEAALARAAVRLGAREVPGWSEEETRLAAAAGGPHAAQPVAADGARAAILAGGDPLGEAFCRIRAAARRRELGQTFTPAPVVESMTGWAARALRPARVVDPGTGSGRFLAAAGRRWPQAELIGVESDPLAAITARGTLAAAGVAARARVLVADYRALRLPPAGGPTLFIGNPPYVRHHQISPRWKAWLRETARGQGLAASGLAGLHAHFFLATALHAVPGDAGVLVTAAEWLDVNYGSLVRALLLGPLGGESVHVLDPAVPAFADAAATAAIACFRPGAAPPRIRLRRVRGLDDLGELAGGAPVGAETLRAATRWGPLVGHPAGARGAGPGGADAAGRGRADPAAAPAQARGQGPRRPPGKPAGYVELGELCRVHRGQVTGANKVWITTADDARLPGRFLVPAVVRARELFAAGAELSSLSGLRCVADLPADLGELAGEETERVAAFLAWAAAAGAARAYVARHRRPWWRVGMRPPAPILATYMARRPPAFVRNPAGARHVNVAHGLYPREPMAAAALDGLAAFLRRSVRRDDGRTYAGGLTKFEPGEMERLPVPAPALLPWQREEARP